MRVWCVGDLDFWIRSVAPRLYRSGQAGLCPAIMWALINSIRDDKMKVTTCENIDVEVSVDVSYGDVISEFHAEIRLAQEAGEVRVRSVVLPAIDSATRLLAAIPDASIAQLLPEHLAEIIKRLKTELARYEPPPVNADADDPADGIYLCESCQ